MHGGSFNVPKSLYNVSGGTCPECGAALLTGDDDGCRSCGWSSLDVRRPAAGNPTDRPKTTAHVTEPRAAIDRPVEVRLAWRVIALIHGTAGSLLTSYGAGSMMTGAAAAGLAGLMIPACAFGAYCLIATVLLVRA